MRDTEKEEYRESIPKRRREEMTREEDAEYILNGIF